MITIKSRRGLYTLLTIDSDSLEGAKLTRAMLPLADLTEAQLDAADLSYATVVAGHLMRAGLKRALLRHAILSYSDFSGASMTEANLNGATIVGCVFSGADLSGALLDSVNIGPHGRAPNFTRANLSGASLRAAELYGADFTRAQMQGVNLHAALYDGSTVWPDGIDPKRAGAIYRTRDAQAERTKHSEIRTVYSRSDALDALRDVHGHLEQAISICEQISRGTMPYGATLLSSNPNHFAPRSADLASAEPRALMDTLIAAANDDRSSDGLLPSAPPMRGTDYLVDAVLHMETATTRLADFHALLAAEHAEDGAMGPVRDDEETNYIAER